jgi:hypothetical protein
MGRRAREAIPALVQALDSEQTGGLAAEALAKIGAVAVPALVAALRQGAECARAHAAYALTRMGTPEAEAAVREVGVPAVEPTRARLCLPAPEMEFDEAKTRVFEELFQSALNRGPGSLIDYQCPYPKYEFLCYLVDRKNLMVHGSSHQDIDVLKPIRWSTDSSTHGNQNAVYADPDGIRPIYFGIIDRTRVRNLHNGFFSAEDRAGVTRRFYQFAIDAEALRRQPWREAMIYLLPRDSFEDVGEWVSRSPVQPLAKLAVVPEDFPILREIRGADYSWRLSWSAEEGFLFLEEAERFPILPKCR